MMREKLSWEVSVLADGVRHSVGDAVELRRGANTLRIAFRNRSGRSVKLDGFQFDGSGISIPGPRRGSTGKGGRQSPPPRRAGMESAISSSILITGGLRWWMRTITIRMSRTAFRRKMWWC